MRKLKPRFGSHMSVAGGLENAFDAGVRAGCDCLQIFVKNQRQWVAPPLEQVQIERYRTAEAQTGLSPVVVHASYLINLASPAPAARARSIAALIDELDRSSLLGIPGVVVHPGAGMGEGDATACRMIARSLDEVHRKRPKLETQVWLETTAGQGSAVGYRFEHFRTILDSVADPERLGICLDTCHLFAAGYDFRTRDGYDEMLGELEDAVGCDRVRCIHVNDSKRACGSRVDRHDHIGKGKIGKSGFAHFVNDPQWGGTPMILETPKGKDGRGTDFDKVNLKRLRSLT